MKTLEQTAKEITEWRESHGFHTPESLTTERERDDMLGKLMLVVTEVAEAAEAIRHGDRENFEEEIADTFIRLFDISGAMEIALDRIIEDKMAKNRKRPIRHGKLCSL